MDGWGEEVKLIHICREQGDVTYPGRTYHHLALDAGSFGRARELFVGERILLYTMDQLTILVFKGSS